jgi:hypothetical protein
MKKNQIYVEITYLYKRRERKKERERENNVNGDSMSKITQNISLTHSQHR